MTAPPSPLATALADRYRLERELGRGGMATVFLAHDLKHDRPVALKVLHPDLASALGPDRFEREIKLAARLQHPNILSVYDSGESAGRLWFTMPYVAGESLRDRLEREKQLPVEEAVRFTREVAEALDFAHRHGVVHRDVKPENILLAEGHALVADFGIARPLGESEKPLTGTGVAIGTPAYMSPEQASGMREVDARTDVYALGCVLFEMLAGEPPYTGPTPQAIIARSMTERPRPLHPMRAGVPEALDAVIAKAMAATTADRYSSAAAMAQALADTGSTRTTTRGPIVRRVIAERPVAAALTLGIILGVGGLFAWRYAHSNPDAFGPKLVAVLPFENLGAPEDEYFADGVADEVRGKLSNLPNVQVIARGSCDLYKKASKSPQQIAQELNVRYLLTATVRWEKAPGNGGRVHVSPELVEVESGTAPRIKWQQPFDASFSDVLEMQGEIADRVAVALQVVLSDSIRERLAEKPTNNLAAYNAYLRGKEIWPSLYSSTPATLRQAATYYARAVALDSGFVLAWTQLSIAHSFLYFNSTPRPEEAEQARKAMERAIDLAPSRAETHLAVGVYYLNVVHDFLPAATAFRLGIGIAPTNTDLITSAGQVEQSLGQWDSVIVHFQTAQRLDPRSVNSLRQLANALLFVRRYDDAQRAIDRALALSPDNLDARQITVSIALMRGDLAEARARIAAVPKEINVDALVAYLAFQDDLYWALDDTLQQRLLHLSPDAFDGDRGTWSIALAGTYWVRQNLPRARAYADTIRIVYGEQLRATPRDPQRLVFLGLALAYLGRKTEAIAAGQRAVDILPITKDAWFGAYIQCQLMRIYIVVGEPEKALDLLEPLLKRPYPLSPGWLKIDPNFDPLRDNPRFRRLVAGGS
jgi:serine/threonine-protein kinase